MREPAPWAQPEVVDDTDAKPDVKPDVKPALLPVLAALATAAVLVASQGHNNLTSLLVLGFSGVACLFTLLAQNSVWSTVSVPLMMLTIVVAIPLNRLGDNSVWRVSALCLTGMAVVLLARHARSLPWGSALLVLLFLQFNFLTLSTLGLEGKSVVILLGLIPVAAFFAAGQLGARERLVMQHAIVALAAVQAVIAICEPIFGLTKLWVPARLAPDGSPNPMANELLGAGLERAQGTLGHPLPLGLLLLLGVVFASRLRSAELRFALIIVLLGGLAAAGTRLATVLALICVVTLGPVGSVRWIGTLFKLAIGVLAFLVATRNVEVGAFFREVLVTGSFTHRIGAFQSVERLLLWQDLPDVLVGHGFGSTQQAFDQGLLQSDGLNAVDNMFVLTLWLGGLLGLCLLVLFLGRVLFNAERLYVPAILAIIVTMWAYDIILWPSSVVLCMLVFGMAGPIRPDAALTPELTDDSAGDGFHGPDVRPARDLR